MWYDLYTIAVRVEVLGHGIFANRGHETEIEPSLLEDALVRVLCDRDGEEGSRLRQKAAELGRICRAARGDLKAVDVIFKLASGESVGA
jgi:UDP:flavonoid glycosyltransferase YjiC (YdhE family)